MFLLCPKCGETINLYGYDNRSEERSLLGVWKIDEIRIAFEKGYAVLHMDEFGSLR